MMPLVVYPDAVQIGLDWLRPELAARPEPYAAGVYVGERVPPTDDRPEVMVILRNSGGTSRTSPLTQARLDAQVWHRDNFAGHALAQLVRGLLHQLAGRGPVRRVADFAGPVPSEDPETRQPRYLLTVEFTLRGSQA